MESNSHEPVSRAGHNTVHFDGARAGSGRSTVEGLAHHKNPPTILHYPPTYTLHTHRYANKTTTSEEAITDKKNITVILFFLFEQVPLTGGYKACIPRAERDLHASKAI